MSKPILYKANETDFTTLGLGVLVDELGTFAIEERNGQFYLEMEYPIDGKHFNELKNDRLIKADASNNLKNQRFKIIRITKPAKGKARVYAEHVSNLSADKQLNPNVSYSGNAQSALNTWGNNITDTHPFTFHSDIPTTGSGRWEVDEVENARRALGGVQGSILDTYGGEYRFDNYHISLLRQRGDDNGIPIMYGKNLIDLEQEEEIASTYTSIYPYALHHPEDSDEAEIITLPELVVDSEHVDKYAHRKILKVNFTADEIETVSELRTRTQRYITENNVGIPKINLRVKFVDLAKTLDYKDIALVEKINLCDWVTVYFDKLDIRQRAKVIKTVWNVGLDRYEEIEIGETRASLSQSMNSVVDGRLEHVEEQINEIRTAANGKNKNHWGPNEPLPQDSKEGDTWFKPIGDGEEEIYRYNGYMWVFVLSTADTTLNKEAIEQVQQEIKQVQARADEAVEQIDTAVSSLGFVDLPNALSSFDGQLVAHQETLDGMQSIVYDPERGVASLNTQLADLVQVAVTGNEMTGAISVLEDNLNLRLVAKDEVITQINASTEGILLQADKIQALADVIVDGKLTITDEFIAPNAQIDGAKIQDATIGSAKIESLDVSKISGNITNFIQSYWNSYAGGSVEITGDGLYSATSTLSTRLRAGELVNYSGTKSGTVNALGMQIYDSANGQTTRLHSDGLEFKWYDIIRGITQTSEGLNIKPTTGSGSRLNSSLELETGPGNDKVAYLQLAVPGANSHARVQLSGNLLSIRHPDGGWATISNYGFDEQQGSLRVGRLRTSTSTGSYLEMYGQVIQTVRTGNQNLLLMPNGTGGVIVGNIGNAKWPITALRFIESSNRDSKTNIQEFEDSGLDIINNLNVVTYNRKDDLANGLTQRDIGFIAEDSPAIRRDQPGGTAGIDNYLTIAYLVKSVQELTVLESNTNKVASQALQATETNAQKIKRLEERIEELEGVA